MKNQPNEMVTLEWLLPLFDQQLSLVAEDWQLDTYPDFKRIGRHYHEISGALIMANLPQLATLAARLSLLAYGTSSGTLLNAQYFRVGQFAHQLLQYELTQYVQTGSYRSALIDRTINKLTHLLPKQNIAADNSLPLNSISADDNHHFLTQTIEVAVPNVTTSSSSFLSSLLPEQYKQLLLVWRQQVQQLLAINTNDATVLLSLKKVSHYLWQAVSLQHTNNADAQQRLWFLTELWLSNLADNSLPLPAIYAQLLSQLDEVLDNRYQQAVDVSKQSDVTSISNTDSTLTTSKTNENIEIAHEDIEGLIADIYIQISGLEDINEQTHGLLSHLSKSSESTLRFLPRILVELESIILGLNNPHTVIAPLQQLQRQLECRGWSRYEAQVRQALSDIKNNMMSESSFAEVSEQIEYQLQELHSAIYNTEQSIHTKIGDKASFVTLATSDNTAIEANAVKSTAFTNDNLRQLRIAVEDLKYNFNDYVYQQQTYLLPTATAFAKISDAFKEMGLTSVQTVSDKLAEVFAKLETHKIKNISWNLTQSLAESLTAIELLLDYLAQQVFDRPLLQQANEHIEQAQRLVDALIAAPDTVVPAFTPNEPILSNVVRYDDSGEIEPTDEVLNKDVSDDEADVQVSATKEMNAISRDSKELQAARTQVKPDNFDMDEEIRDIFIEEAGDVLTDLKELLPIWQQDTQDLSPLTEVRRGFHTLKGSGRMVGAFTVSEMAWAIENLLNRVLDKTIAVTEDVVTLVTQTTAHLSVLVADFAALQEPSTDPVITIVQSSNLLAGKSLSAGLDISVESGLLASDHQKKIQSASTDEQNMINPYNTASNEFISEPQETISDSVVLSNNAQANDAQTNKQSIPTVLEPFIQQAQQLPIDAQDSDPEIKEIFIEEAEEVLDEITPKYEQWRLVPSDLTGLKEVRRGFHTLKGSGRMVGAYYTGELAWSIEDMLNRILDHTIAVSTDIIQLVTDVLATYPDLIKTFANNNEHHNEDYPAIVILWVACANAYSKKHGDKFSYVNLRKEWFVDSQNDTSINDDKLADSSDKKYGDDGNDDILETIHSINEMMAEAPVVITPQSAEEQTFYKIFVEEARSLLQDINDFVTAHDGEEHIEVTDEIVRAFHTLRAASGSSALTAISEISANIEHSLEQLQNYDTPMSAHHLQALAQSVKLIEGYLDAYQQSLEQDLTDEHLQNKEDLVSLQKILDESNATHTLIDNKLSVAKLLETDVDTLLNAEWELGEALNNGSIEQVQSYVQKQIEQIRQLTSQTKESPKFTSLLAALNSVYSYLNNNIEAAYNAKIQTILFAGHRQLIGLFDALAGSMSLKVDQQVLQDLHAIGTVDDEVSSNVSNDRLIGHQETQETEIDESTTVKSIQADTLQLEAIDTDIELLEIFLEEAQELDSAIAQSFSKWRADSGNMAALKVLQRHLHTIKGGARMAGIRSIGDLTHEAESIYEAFIEQRLHPTAQWLTIMQMVQDTLSLQIDYVVRYQEAFFANDLIEQLQGFERSDQLPKAITLVLPALQNHNNNDLNETEDIPQESEQASDTVSLDSIIAESWTDGLPDPDILEVFLEEADEIVVSSNKYLQLFLGNVSDVAALQALQRDLHTIKGGARMVAANGIADLAHEMETVYEELAILRKPATKMISQLLTDCHDWLADAVFILKQQVNPPTPNELILALKQFSKNPDDLKHIPNETLQSQRSMILAAKMLQQSGRVVENLKEMPSMAGSFAEQEQSTGSNEMIRISGGLIEHMINLSGESAINRARIDMGISSLTNSIEEMGTTVQRLADQLRRMEIELEAQILSQIDDDELVNNEDFDPLEMDQYSSLNQLSKSLTESASDLIEINSTMLEKTRDSEGLLLQLSRTQTELQDGLMNSRMVPFTRVTPRLERIVRQTANELNKSVELTVINADDEMDRTILERITSPLEHMLRNAVDHGIENVQTRLTAGKSRSGHITLEVLREGSEVVINLSDDGRGINVEAVRNKAIAQGLIDANDNSLTDLDIIQYIFNAGLTTSQQVTQISGRGVGMDVVISEIRQLGGMVTVTSEEGRGSRFIIRLPLTVAVSDALVVRAADRYYAIPLVQIERVIRVNPENLYDYYASGDTTLHIEDEDYRVRYLNEILSGSKLNELMVSTNTSLPLIVIKNRTGQKMALQVDQIAGSRIEVVLKPLGRQLSHLAGISAATIMGDGSVMLILDLIALMRNASTQNTIQAPKLERSGVDTPVTVLVVDDSVTVRKVTSRLLERQGINVALAKDGVDAIEILQETIPDLILLDIEMPRMDGFEVATQVRFDKRLRDIPIIMITSRTGEKHRERALDIGVNDYMGKPFQETELLNRMQILLGQKISLSHDG
ncbi:MULTISPECIES: Hpt domain-containing protein [unclassified Psychrobacter]|uniref:Hpt domain-containing protein n=1 Tax=unclassified Psychrobacter TaxID=196806 RepID=UPI00071E6986|nr:MULTISPECIES: Hpt domain-containing protein [unclassified Psychrobacter]OLF38941.1 hybrid sensor histidine kinase/response regulator [Psychrobacter sp. Cmf 22.2]